MLSHEDPGGQLTPTKSKNLPNKILRAIDAAMHTNNLPRQLRSTLAELVRFVSQDRPFETIFAKKQTIALRTQTSVETIYRHLSMLRSLGLIDTLEQERKSRNGRFAVARIRLTIKCASLLGFIPGEAASTADGELNTVPSLVCQMDVIGGKQSTEESSSTSSSARREIVVKDNPSLEIIDSNTRFPEQLHEVIHSPPSVKMTCGHTLTKPTNSKSQPTPRTQNGLPMDLTWLTRNGLTRSGIFKLMGIARQAGKLLSDVVTAVHSRIEAIKGARLFAYLKALATGPTDFAVTAANARRAIEKAKQEQKDRVKVSMFRQRFRNTALTNRAGTKLFVIDERSEFAQVYSRDRALGCSPLTDLREWIAGVENGTLVLATLALERQFPQF